MLSVLLLLFIPILFLIVGSSYASHTYAAPEIDKLAHALHQVGKSRTEKLQHSELEKMLKQHKEKQQERIKEGKKIKAEFHSGDINYLSIIKELQKAGLIPDGVTIEASGAEVTSGASATVFFVTKKDEAGALIYEAAVRVVLKEDRSHKQLLRDLNLVQFANQLGAIQNVRLPIIVEPRGGLKIGGNTVIVYDKARGKRLDTLFGKEFSTMSDEDIKAMFFSLGEQMGNLDRLFYREKGGILCHPDSHPGNFLYDYDEARKTGQFYWLDTAGIRVQKGVSSSFKMVDNCLKWFTRINVPGIGIHWKNGRFTQEKDLDTILHDLRDKKISRDKKNELIGKYNDLVRLLQKERLALKSFGQGYVKGNPQAKEIFNALVKGSKYWGIYIERLAAIAEILGLKASEFPDPIQR